MSLSWSWAVEDWETASLGLWWWVVVWLSCRRTCDVGAQGTSTIEGHTCAASLISRGCEELTQPQLEVLSTEEKPEFVYSLWSAWWPHPWVAWGCFRGPPDRKSLVSCVHSTHRLDHTHHYVSLPWLQILLIDKYKYTPQVCFVKTKRLKQHQICSQLTEMFGVWWLVVRFPTSRWRYRPPHLQFVTSSSTLSLRWSRCWKILLLHHSLVHMRKAKTAKTTFMTLKRFQIYSYPLKCTDDWEQQRYARWPRF